MGSERLESPEMDELFRVLKNKKGNDGPLRCRCGAWGKRICFDCSLKQKWFEKNTEAVGEYKMAYVRKGRSSRDDFGWCSVGSVYRAEIRGKEVLFACFPENRGGRTWSTISRAEFAEWEENFREFDGDGGKVGYRKEDGMYYLEYIHAFKLSAGFTIIPRRFYNVFLTDIGEWIREEAVSNDIEFEPPRFPYQTDYHVKRTTWEQYRRQLVGRGGWDVREE